MKRKTAIRNIIVISAGTALLPACGTSDKNKFPLKNISLTGAEEDMLANLTKNIIPKTNDFIGAEDLKSHEFLLIMIDDCSGPEDQKKFQEGLKSFEEMCSKKFGRTFSKCTQQQKNDILKELDASKDDKNPAQQFYRAVKRYTVQSYTSSKEYMTEIAGFKLVPGRIYKGCVPVKKG